MPMAKSTAALKPKGIIASMNVTSRVSVGPCVETLGSIACVILLQEHRITDPTKLAVAQREMQDLGAVGGVAILAKAPIFVTAPPLLDSPVLHEGRMPGDDSVYLVDSVGSSVVNWGILLTLLRYPAQLNAAGYDWEANGVWVVPMQTAHRSYLDNASTIGYFIVSGNLGPRIFEPTLQELGAAAPHLPVELRLFGEAMKILVRVLANPRPMPAAPPNGRARGGEDWTKTSAKVLQAKEARADKKRGGPAHDSVRGRCVEAPQGIRYPDESDDHVQQLLVQAWDAVLDTVEQGLLDRCDKAGEQRRKYVGRSGDLATALRPAKLATARASGAAGPARWGLPCRGEVGVPLVGAGAFVAKSLRPLQASDAACELSSLQCSKLACFLLETMGYLDNVARHHEIIALLPQWAQDFFLAGMRVLLCHELEQLQRPRDTDQWEPLPTLTVGMLQAAVPFPTSTASGPARIGARALARLSMVGVHVCAALFTGCEEVGALPSGRTWREMARLPKPTGGCRLITLMHAMFWWWTRARTSVSKAWLSAHPGGDIWGMGGGRSSPDSAFDRNIETEIFAALGEYTLAVLMGAWEFLGTIVRAALLAEAREMGMPLRLVWMLLELYRQPRRLCAFGPASYDVVAWQGVLAGCAHACAMVSLLLHRLWAAVTRFRKGARAVGIIIQSEKSGYVTPPSAVAQRCRWRGGARGLKGRHWARKLGHDLCGRRKVRRQAAERMKALAARGGRLLHSKMAVGRRVGCLWKAVLLPSAAHGGGVSGFTGATFGKLRGDAGMLVGARQGLSSVTVVLATQRAVACDLICDLVCRFASWVWEQRTPLARGPIASTILTPWRVGWFMRSSTALVTDEENHVNLLTESPKDARMHVAMGVERWQGRQIFQHYLQCDQQAKVWVRAMRRCIGGPKAAVAEGPGAVSLRARWAGVPWTRQAQFEAKLTTSSACAACGAESDTPGHRIFGCEALLEPA
ncbi:unnamed protein product, partial [Prorocentrum cordatum]